METQKNKKAKPKILYVDDELASLTGFKSIFRNHYDVYTAKSANEGYDIMKKENISLVISDQRMPGETGVEFLQKIRLDFPDAVRMIVTGYSDIDAVIKAINKSMVYYYFSKPFEADDMKMIMDNAIERLELRRQNKELLDRLSVMVDKLKQHKAKLEKEVKQRQLAEEEVRKLNKDLLVLDKAKADFLRIISHEIRTPLNGIIGPFQLLKDGILSADFKDILTILDASVKRLEKFALTALKITDLQT
ncbi:MAG: response regulator, partial [Bacteroidales bacterium]|nr:response regulator [Bacteroidales bacterium]